MPTYEYACPKCGHEFEQFQPMSDPPLKRCPHCKKLGLKRLVGAGAGLIFKGTGFYITDYKNKAGGSKGATEAKSESKPGGEGKPADAASKPAAAESKKAGSGDSKPAAKT